MKRLMSAALIAACGWLTACDSVTNSIDCNTICDRYQTCYNKSYDTGACAKRCRDSANTDSDYMQKSQTCSACLDNNKDCVSTTFSCGAQCVGIVP